jgi:DNA modification methylase
MSRTINGVPVWPADQVERWPLERIITDPNNPRTHSDEQVAQIVASMQEWGWTMPILVDDKGNLIAGHGRLRAAELLGFVDAPVMVAHGWTEAQIRAYRIADNKLALNAGWDEELLAQELVALREMDFDLGMTGFGMDELDALLGASAGEAAGADEVPEPPEYPVSRPGDLWVLGSHRVKCGDSTSAADVEAALEGVTPVLMVTDPPYGVSYEPGWRDAYDAGRHMPFSAPDGHLKVHKLTRHALGKVDNDDRSDWREAWDLFPGNIAYVWHGGLHAATVQASLEAAGFDVRAQIIWAKQHFVLSRGDYHWQHEPCWYAVRKGKTGNWNGDRSQTTVWEIANNNPVGGQSADDAITGHGTQKPVECMKRPIENNSLPGDTIYEPFCGSGTTIIAAEITERRCVALEINPVYVDVAVRRWQNFTGQQAVHAVTGETFETETIARQAAESSPREASVR